MLGIIISVIIGIVIGVVLQHSFTGNEQKKELVNHPQHYKNTDGKECIDCMREEYGDSAVYWFCVLNAYKYRFRAGNKDGNSFEQDIKKAEWYENYAHRLNKN